MELRLAVDPSVLKPNPKNPRLTAPPDFLDGQILASVKAIGLIQPPLVYEMGGDLVIDAGHRRVRACVAAGLSAIPVLVVPVRGDAPDPMRAVAENVVRAEMGQVDRWRSMESLVAAGWNEAAIADALNLTQRNIAQMRLLAKICPAMLDHMALNDIPDMRQLRVIANATMEEQTQVWKKHRPKRGNAASWHQISNALTKARMKAADAKFGATEAEAFGIVWEADLFAPAGEDNRSTTQVEAFLHAQMAWLEANLKANQCIVDVDEWGRGKLPKGAEQHYGRFTKGIHTAFCVSPRTGAIESLHYTVPSRETRKDKPKASGAAPVTASRPPVTNRGCAMIGDYRTDALHQALRQTPIEDDQLLAMLVLAFGAYNVTVQSGVADQRYSNQLRRIANGLTHGGVLAQDMDVIRTAARATLVEVLSCRQNYSGSGTVARIAGAAIGADVHLPNMATEEFLSALSRAALDACAAENSIATKPKLKDTRAAIVGKFLNGTFVYAGARFALSDAELKSHQDHLIKTSEDAHEGEADPDQEAGTTANEPFDEDGLGGEGLEELAAE